MYRNTFTGKKGKSRYKSFYTAIGISILMIGAACIYAYNVTSNTLEEELANIAEYTQPAQTTAFVAKPYDRVTTAVTTTEAYAEVVKVETNVPVVTTMTTVVAVQLAEPEPAAVAVETEVVLSHKRSMPADGEVAKPFSNGELVKSETTGTWQTHNGVDILSAMGTSVFAMDNGTVVEVENDALWGICVTIDHENGIVSRYCNLDPALEVQEGDTVTSGEVIGKIGATADMESSMEAHLHFEVLQSGKYIDAYEYVRAS